MYIAWDTASASVVAYENDVNRDALLGDPRFMCCEVYRTRQAPPYAGLPADADPQGVPLAEYAARRRWEILQFGWTKVGELRVPTDDTTQGKLAGAALKATRNPAYVVRRWKVAKTMTFVTLNATQIFALADAVEERVQTLFEREEEVCIGITSGTVTTPAQVDAILAGDD